MNLLENLKNLKHIEPSRDFKEKSRALILNTLPAQKIGIFDIILKKVEIAASVGLAGVLIFLIFGGFSAWKFMGPLNVSGLDPTGLKAEADAVDMQIELTNLNYNAPNAAAPVAESTPSTSAPKPAAQPPAAAPLDTSNTATATDNTTSSPYVPIDNVLQTLGQ